MKILLHSSKTMKPEVSSTHAPTTPLFLKQAIYLNKILQAMDTDQIANLMQVTKMLAIRVCKQAQDWDNKTEGSAAALTFRGDIYSGLAAAKWQKDDASFAQEHLLILSGLYGLLRPFDKIKPYRLEMGYKLKVSHGKSLDSFWQEQLANALDANDVYINLTAKEYFKVVQKQLANAHVISPRFLTISQKTGEPVFVTVHAKIARGAFASWLITNKINDPKNITGFDQLNYTYDSNLSTDLEPVFVCREFGGIGLSVRLA